MQTFNMSTVQLGQSYRPAFALPFAYRQCKRTTRVSATGDKDSFKKLEEPVRPKETAVPPLDKRESNYDQVLKSDKLNPDREVLGTEVGTVDAMRFQGALPEVVNSRAAMLGFALAVLGQGITGLNIYDQIKSWPGPVIATFGLIFVASLVPVLRGLPRRDFGPFKAEREIVLGRFAMFGVVGLFWIPFVNGYHLW
jgi:hypothetical protein